MDEDRTVVGVGTGMGCEEGKRRATTAGCVGCAVNIIEDRLHTTGLLVPSASGQNLHQSMGEL